MKQILLGIAPGTLFHKGVHMRVTKRDWGSLYETDVLILGTGASGMGAALKAAEKHADVLMLGKGTLESSGSLGGGNDHFMAVLDTDEAYDNVESFMDFYMKSAVWPCLTRLARNSSPGKAAGVTVPSASASLGRGGCISSTGVPSSAIWRKKYAG